MSFQLSTPKNLAKDVRRITVDEVTVATMAFTETVELEMRIHEARRAFKRVRALLRLMRARLGDAVYRRENAVLKAASRQLSPLRDADVLVHTAKALASRRGPAGLEHDQRASPSTAHGVARRAAGRRDRVMRTFLGEDAVRAVHISALRALERRVLRWPLRGAGFEVITAGLRGSYARGRLCQLKAAGSGRPELFHDWRKRAKDLRHHLELLRCAWPTVLGATATEVHRLTDLLGEGNDLSVLLQALASEPDLTAGLRGGGGLLGVSEQRRAFLWKESASLGASLYAEPPSAFLRRVHRYWDHWEGCPEADPVGGLTRRVLSSASP